MSKKRGYIYLWKQFSETCFFNDSAAVHVAICLLIDANYADTTTYINGEKITIKRGQTLTGIHSLAEKTGLKSSTIRNKLDKLKRVKFLVRTSLKRCSLVTICKYNEYQGKKPPKKEAVCAKLDTPNKDKEIKTKYKRLVEGQRNKKHDLDGQEIKLSLFLLNFILKRNPSHKKPDLQKWASAMDKILRLDGRSAEEVKKVIRWSQEDSFWQNNILSPVKLRKQFDQLALKMNSVDGKIKTPQVKVCKDCGTASWTAYIKGRCEKCHEVESAKY